MMSSLARMTPPTAGADSDSSSDESSLASNESSDDDEEEEPESLERVASPAAFKNATPSAAPAGRTGDTSAGADTDSSSDESSLDAPRINQEKLTLTLLAYKWSKLSQNHKSVWISPDGAEYKSAAAILEAFPELYDLCA